MKNYDVKFELSYSGSDAENHEIDLYDVSQALVGFQRSLAITTHLILNDEIITQAPALKGAQIFAFPSEEGSWKIKVGIAIASAAAYNIGTAPNNTLLGHLVYSAYDYVISESLGFHVDYNKSLSQLYEEAEKNKIKLPVVRESQLDSVIEKCSVAITEIHRPIYKNQTAETAIISANINNRQIPLNPIFSFETFQYIIEEYEEDQVVIIYGFVSSYNANTFKGRIYVPDEKRPISFELADNVRGKIGIQLIVESLRANALRNFKEEPIEVYCKARRITTRSGHLKKYKILDISGEKS